jgi:hypothetical protein
MVIEFAIDHYNGFLKILKNGLVIRRDKDGDGQYEPRRKNFC